MAFPTAWRRWLHRRRPPHEARNATAAPAARPSADDHAAARRLARLLTTSEAAALALAGHAVVEASSAPEPRGRPVTFRVSVLRAVVALRADVAATGQAPAVSPGAAASDALARLFFDLPVATQTLLFHHHVEREPDASVAAVLGVDAADVPDRRAAAEAELREVYLARVIGRAATATCRRYLAGLRSHEVDMGHCESCSDCASVAFDLATLTVVVLRHALISVVGEETATSYRPALFPGGEPDPRGEPDPDPTASWLFALDPGPRSPRRRATASKGLAAWVAAAGLCGVALASVAHTVHRDSQDPRPPGVVAIPSLSAEVSPTSPSATTEDAPRDDLVVHTTTTSSAPPESRPPAPRGPGLALDPITIDRGPAGAHRDVLHLDAANVDDAPIAAVVLRVDVRGAAPLGAWTASPGWACGRDDGGFACRIAEVAARSVHRLSVRVAADSASSTVVATGRGYAADQLVATVQAQFAAGQHPTTTRPVPTRTTTRTQVPPAPIRTTTRTTTRPSPTTTKPPTTTSSRRP